MRIFVILMSVCFLLISGYKLSAKENQGNNLNKTKTTTRTQQFEKVSFTTPDGMILSANFYKANLKSKNPIILMFHQVGSNKESFKPLIDPLIKENYNVLSVDFRGHGKSTAISNELPKKYPEFTNSDWAGLVTDVNSSIDFLKGSDTYKQNGIILIGASIGANAAILASSENKIKAPIKAIVLISPGLDYHKLLIKPAINKSTIKTLIISAIKDDYAFSSYKHLQSLHKDNLKFVSYPINSHGTNLFIDYPSSIKDITHWISKIK